jgi:hypothetical protein
MLRPVWAVGTEVLLGSPEEEATISHLAAEMMARVAFAASEFLDAVDPRWR